MRDEQGFDGSVMFLGTMIGLIVGGMLALLYSPLTGRELMAQAQQGAETVRRSVNQVEGSISEGRKAVQARQQGVITG